MATISYSIGVGWVSPMLPILLTDESPLTSGALTVEESSWVSSILCIGGLIGTILFGWMIDRFGRRMSGLLCAIPLIASWALIAFGDDFIELLIGRFLCGFGGGGAFVVIPVYVSEIADIK